MFFFTKKDMDQKIIPFTKGITRSPSDLLCSDFELSKCVNLIPENESLSPIVFPKLEENIIPESGMRLIYIHKTNEYKNYIFYYNGELYCANEDNPSPVMITTTSVPKQVSSIGNTMIITTSSGMNYFLYKTSDLGVKFYKYIGNKIPEYSDIKFSLVSTVVNSEDKDIPKNEITGLGSTQIIEAKYVSDITDGVYGNFNALVSKLKSEGKFCFPFFIRYALVLFDGTLIEHSAPVLMITTDCRPLFGVYGTTKVMTTLVSSSLYIRCLSKYNSDWKDIIKGIEIYVSPQLYTVKITNNINRYYTPSSPSYSFSGMSSTLDSSQKGYWDNYKPLGTVTNYNGQLSSYGDSSFVEGRLSGTKNYVAENMADYASSFYKLIYYSLDDLDKIYDSIPKWKEIKCGDLGNLENRIKMTDDYFSHTKLMPAGIFTYNNRLNIFSPSRSFFNGFSHFSNYNVIGSEDAATYAYTITVFLKTGDGIKYINFSFSSNEIIGPFFFYPDTRAYKAVIKRVENDTTEYLYLNLKESKYINGSIYTIQELYDDYEYADEETGVNSHAINSLLEHAYSIGEEFSPLPDSEYEYLPNKIIASDVNNPFSFPLSGWNTVGTGRIIGIGSTTKTLSEGQFGQFPLIVFSADGIWAMTVGDDGTYVAKQPISREVCSNAESITTIDDAIIFVTKSGLKAVSGSNVIDLSEQMSGSIQTIDCEYSDSIFDNLVSNHDTELDFINYIQSAKIAFDYVSSRLIIYKSGSNFSYIYSLKSHNYSSMLLDDNILYNINDYPDNILQYSDYKLYSLLNKDLPAASTERKFGYALTRPMKLDNPIGLKTIHRIKNIGVFNRKNSFVKCVIYGSNDLAKWFKIHSTHGVPFKYFRLGLYTNLVPFENISGSILEIENKRTNKLR